MQVYELAFAWYEDYSPHLFTSDRNMTPDEWERLCDVAMIEAARLAVEKGVEYVPGRFDLDQWIDWSGLTEMAARILVREHGMKPLKPIKASCWGGIIEDDKDNGKCQDWGTPENPVKGILPPDVLDRVIRHNRAFRAKLYKRNAEVAPAE